MSSNFPLPPRPPLPLPFRPSHLLNSNSSIRQWIEHLLCAWLRSRHWGQMSFPLMELAQCLWERHSKQRKCIACYMVISIKKKNILKKGDMEWGDDGNFIDFFLKSFAMPRGRWDPSSPTRDQTGLLLLFSDSVVSDFFVTPWTTARIGQASLSFTISRRLLKLKSIELVMPSNHLILCRPLLLPSIFPSIRVFSNESVLHWWPKYWR